MITAASINPSARRLAHEAIEKAAILDPDVEATLLQAFLRVRRQDFFEARWANRADQDIALPIGFGEDSTPPSTIARFLSVAGIRKGMRILEIGGGSGYASAVMAAAGAVVFSMEMTGLLAQRTRRLLDSLSLSNVIVRRGDGSRGWSEHAPYDAIISWISFPSLDRSIRGQIVSPSGCAVIPIARESSTVLTRSEWEHDVLRTYELEQVAVPRAR